MTGLATLLGGGSGAQAAAQQQRHIAQQQALAALQAQQAAGFYASTTSSTTTTTNSFTWVNTSSATSAATTVGGPGLYIDSDISPAALLGMLPSEFQIPAGRERKVTLPDGTVIEIDQSGSFKIVDDKAKVVYAANRSRDFNPFINASDKLEAFIRYCNTEGVRQGEMLDLPLKLFVWWLVVEAAKADREPEPTVPLLADLRQRSRPRCINCGRFISVQRKAARIEFCGPSCFEREHARLAA